MMDCSQLANMRLERLDGVDESATPSEVTRKDVLNETDTAPTIEVNDNDGEQDEDNDDDDYDNKGLLQSLSPTHQLGPTPPMTFRRRSDSTTTIEDGDQNESKVLVIYTGGTIGMIRNDENSKYI